ncbi:MAG TPA: radical SAM protein [Gammaproteobacteria bacterium]|nr:radical SAM protein [Gammaproteobacteria bacterium]
MHKPVLAYTIGDKRYLNITDRCTLRCAFCPKFRTSPQVHEFDLRLPRRPETGEIIDAMGDPGAYREIVFCGFGEPTLRLKPLLEIAGHVRERGGRVRVNTDGLANRVHKRNVLPELARCVDALSVSMNAHNEALYERHCRPALPGSFAAMLDFLERAPAYIPEVTATAIDGLEGVDIDACRELARARGVAFRRRVLDVVG